jgi:hypothetical protein
MRSVEEVYGQVFDDQEIDAALDEGLSPRGLNEIMFDLVAQADLLPGSLVLDVGAREGALLRAVASLRVHRARSRAGPPPPAQRSPLPGRPGQDTGDRKDKVHSAGWPFGCSSLARVL